MIPKAAPKGADGGGPGGDPGLVSLDVLAGGSSIPDLGIA